jgi:hypothetical protein
MNTEFQERLTAMARDSSGLNRLQTQIAEGKFTNPIEFEAAKAFLEREVRARDHAYARSRRQSTSTRTLATVGVLLSVMSLIVSSIVLVTFITR